MSKRYGVIDLGTNTFHLLIAEKNSDTTLKELYRERIFVKLGEEGIEKIGDAALARGMEALKRYEVVLDEYEVVSVKAFGTAALRTAQNGPEFITKVKKETGIAIELIPGDKEARLIHLGVTQAVPMGSEKGLIMDIGGGSVEFIIADADGVLWAQSFPIGVSVLFNQFHKSDPISDGEIQSLEKYLYKVLEPLSVALKHHETSILIGASGTFDVLENILSNQRFSDVHSQVIVEHFFPLYRHFIKTTQAERYQMEKLPNSRADMIIVALILINLIIHKAGIKRISISAYAMKEGILAEMVG